MEKYAGYEKVFLFPPSLEDWVGPDHPARFIREFVDSLDLEQLGFAERKSDEGRPNYANDMLLKVWIYGYMNRIRTARRLEKACREHLSLLWLTGGHEPDHNTLWRFWDRNRQAIRQIFRQSVKIGYEIGCVGFVLHALDGTKITARSSKRTAWHRKDLEKRLADLDREIKELERALADGETDRGEYRLPERLIDRQALQMAIRGALDRLDQRSENHLHPHEPEANLVKNHGVVEFGYNGQSVVDDQSKMIVHNDVVADAYDQRQLIPMLDQLHHEWGRVAEETVADGGYNTESAIAEAEQKGYSVTLAAGPADEESRSSQEYHASKFTFDRERDVVVCPRGEALHFESNKNKGGGRIVAVYRCAASEACPVRNLCTQSKKGRSVEIGPHHEAVMRQKLKRKTPQGRAHIRIRATLAERPFAIIKQVLEYRRAAATGLSKVKTEWSFICAIHNLRILLRHWTTGVRLLAT
ncbi:MAG: IS1182 family transposase [Gemmatimonadaceae bacterium]